MIRRLHLLCLAGLLANTLTCGASPLDAFPHRKSLRMNESKGEGVGRFALDEEVFAEASTGYANLRIVSRNGEEIACAVSSAAEGLRSYTRQMFESRESGRQTIISFETMRVPLKSVRLVTSDRDFVRDVRLEGSDSHDDVPGWRKIASGTVSVVRSGRTTKKNLTVSLPAVTRYSKYRLVIENQDSPPLRIDDVELEGSVVGVRFLCNQDSEYFLYYGGHAAAPRYDLAKVLSSGARRNEDVYTLDWHEDNPDYSPVRAAGGSNGRTILIVAMVLALVTLGWLVVVSLRKVDSITFQ